MAILRSGAAVGKHTLERLRSSAIQKENKRSLNTSGIYAIVNITNGHKYIGQSKDIGERWNGHRSTLRTGKHGNLHLQHAWNFYTPESFKFVVLERCQLVDLNEREQYWINKVKPEYNIVNNIYERYACKATDHPDGYIKPGESFVRPTWHLWVYGGQKNPNL